MKKLQIVLLIIAVFIVFACTSTQNKIADNQPIDYYYKILDKDVNKKISLTEEENAQFMSQNIITTFSDEKTKEKAVRYYIASANILMNSKEEKEIMRLARYAESENALVQYGILLSFNRALHYYENYGARSKYNKNIPHKKFYHVYIKELSKQYQSSPNSCISICALKAYKRTNSLYIPGRI